MGVEDLPAWMASAWGLPVYAAQAMLTSVIVVALILPPIILRKDKGNFNNVEAVLVILGLYMSTAIGWLNSGIFLVLLLMSIAIWALLAGKVFGD